MELPKSERYIQYKSWAYKLTADDTQIITDCPYCDKPEHLYIARGGAKDGLFDCKVCGKTGNLYQLQLDMGDRINGVISMQDAASSTKKAEPLPNAEANHVAMMNDADALDYLVHERGLSLAVIEKQKLGLAHRDGKRWLSIPYFHKGNLVYAKYRTLPPEPREFANTSGREAPLYNEDALKSGMEDVIFTEGEIDAITLLSVGLENVVGIPGANMKKAIWITRLDELAPKKIYMLYDRDKVGQKSAREMALRIGLDKVYNIVLPEFQTFDGKTGKDVNDWFRAGHTLEEFDVLKKQARPFDVTGVSSVLDVLEEIESDLSQKGNLEPTLTTPWPSVNSRLGGAEWGDLIGVIAEGKVGKTTMALNWVDFYSLSGLSCLFYCLEMLPKRLARKWASYVTKTDDTPGKSQVTPATIQLAKTIALGREGDLLFGYNRVSKSDEVFDTIKQAVRRYGVKVVVFDNLQLLVRSIEHSAQETSVLTKRFKELAMELGILVILIIQPNRVREGEIVAARNAMGSSAIEKDVDAMIALHRNRVAKIKEDDFKGFLDTDENFEPMLLVRVDLSRYSPGGVTTLWFDGAISEVRELTNEEKGTYKAPVYGVDIPTEGQPAVTV